MHEQCLNSYISKCSSDAFSCPNCKQTFDVPLGEGWSTEELIENLRDGLDADFDEDTHVISEQCRSTRVLRSMGDVKPMTRRLRSHGDAHNY
jgi:hypothetical protein